MTILMITGRVGVMGMGNNGGGGFVGGYAWQDLTLYKNLNFNNLY